MPRAAGLALCCAWSAMATSSTFVSLYSEVGNCDLVIAPDERTGGGGDWLRCRERGASHGAPSDLRERMLRVQLVSRELDPSTHAMTPWLTLGALDQKGGRTLELIPPGQPLAWVVRLSAPTAVDAAASTHARHFAIEAEDGNATRVYVRARALLALGHAAHLNVIRHARCAVRAHSTSNSNPRDAGAAAGREPSARFVATWLSWDEAASAGHADRAAATPAAGATTPSRATPSSGMLPAPPQSASHQPRLVGYYAEDEQPWLAKIHALPRSSEKRVISYGLYGSAPKYITGALRNAELAKAWFPGWQVRFYTSDDVPRAMQEQLTARGAELVPMTGAKGIAGMFWRFLVADDEKVDRYLVRDSDSRLNPRERMAVEEWIESGHAVHSIRDHPNHRRTLNGGLWGGTRNVSRLISHKGGVSGLIKKWGKTAKYGDDLKFLCQVLWPLIERDQLSHDAYSCDAFPNSRSFPTKRPRGYQHVGQVFDDQDNPRMGDIDRFIKNREVPKKCRRKSEWKFG